MFRQRFISPTPLRPIIYRDVVSLSGKLVSIQTARAKTYAPVDVGDGQDKPWRTAFYKTPVSGPILAAVEGLAGDQQADRRFHGGPDKAILAYSVDHHAYWASILGEVPFGGFGENLSIAGLNEQAVCIGDQYQLGPVRLEVSQPRQPCKKLARRWNRPDLVGMVIDKGFSGWYLRVLEEGTIEAGMELQLIDRINEDWTILRANHVMNLMRKDVPQMRALAAVPKLSADWVIELTQRADRVGNGL